MLFQLKYTNESIRNIYKVDKVLLWIGMGMFVAGAILFLSGLWTANRMVKEIKPIEQVLSEEGNHANKTAYVNLTEAPVKITEDQYEGYYLITDGEHLYISGMQEADYNKLNADYLEYGSVVLEGVTKVIIDEDVREDIAAYLSSIGVSCDSETIDDYIGGVQIRVSEISFSSMLKEGASVPLILGGLLWLFGVFFLINEYSSLLKYRKITSIRDVTPAQLDEEANDPESIYLGEICMYLTPSFVVGLYNGITVLRYDEITDIYISKCNEENSQNKIKITARGVNDFEYLLYECKQDGLSQSQEDDIYMLNEECKVHNVHLICEIEDSYI